MLRKARMEFYTKSLEKSIEDKKRWFTILKIYEKEAEKDVQDNRR